MRTLSRLKMVFVLIILGLSFAHSSVNVSALSGSSFNPENIISDAVFYNPSALTTAQVQNFLNSKVPTCDTNGTRSKSYYYNSLNGQVNNSKYVDANKDGANDNKWVTTSRAIYGQRYATWYNAHPYSGYITNESLAPFTCLKDYKMDTPSKTAADSDICGYLPARAGRSAANIITDVSAACGISPKVLIILLQKEQGLVTDDWPWKNQFLKATGYACPDTPSGCNSAYYGFFNQVYKAAWQYKIYRANPDQYNFGAGRAHNYVHYQADNPATAINEYNSCGYKDLNIRNQATAGLYIYTPYQPNKAALNNLYGTGDGCSAYGNRNFWRYFMDWFGSTQTNTAYDWLLVSKTVYADSARTQVLTGNVQHLAPGQKAYVEIKAYNNGTQSWDPSFVRVGTSSPNDRTSAFYDSSWISSTRPGAVSSVTPPGEIGTFDFAITAPSSTSYNEEHFNLVAEGRTWMKDLGLKFYLDVNNPIQTVTTDYQLQPGERLLPGQALLSRDTKAAFELQRDGNAVVYKDFVAAWNSGTNDKKVNRIEMQTDGNLVIYSTTGKALWNSKTYNNPGAFLEMQTDGNLVIYNSSRTSAIWNAKTGGRPDGLTYVNSRMFPRSHMISGQSLNSPDSKFRLSVQTDGNLVLYNNSGLALWNSRTAHHAGAYLNLQPDGNLVLYDASGKPLWNTHTDHSAPGQLLMQPDGNLVLYDASGKPLWKSDTVQKTLLATSTNSRKANQSLTVGQNLNSTNGKYRLALQPDGNLVLYDTANKALWSSRTNDKPVTTVNMQPDGNFVAYDSSGKYYWDTRTNDHPGSLVMLQDNGQLVVYDVYSHVLWSTPGQ